MSNNDTVDDKIDPNTQAIAIALEALQDALICLDGQQYKLADPIYDEEPYALQKKAVRTILEL